MSASGTTPPADPLNQARRAMARSVGFTELQRRAVAAVCLIDGCTAEQAEAAMVEAELDLLSRNCSLWPVPDDDIAVEYAVGKALCARRALQREAAPRLRVLKRGAS